MCVGVLVGWCVLVRAFVFSDVQMGTTTRCAVVRLTACCGVNNNDNNKRRVGHISYTRVHRP